MDMFKKLAEDSGIREQATDLGKNATSKYKETGGIAGVVGDDKIKADATTLGKDAYAKLQGNGTENKPEGKKSDEKS
jgi:hypothetical protein